MWLINLLWALGVSVVAQMTRLVSKLNKTKFYSRYILKTLVQMERKKWNNKKYDASHQETSGWEVESCSLLVFLFKRSVYSRRLTKVDSGTSTFILWTQDLYSGWSQNLGHIKKATKLLTLALRWYISLLVHWLKIWVLYSFILFVIKTVMSC